MRPHHAPVTAILPDSQAEIVADPGEKPVKGRTTRSERRQSDAEGLFDLLVYSCVSLSVAHGQSVGNAPSGNGRNPVKENWQKIYAANESTANEITDPLPFILIDVKDADEWRRTCRLQLPSQLGLERSKLVAALCNSTDHIPVSTSTPSRSQPEGCNPPDMRRISHQG